MATATGPVHSVNHEDLGRRVSHPLERLRSSIRAYVSAEGLALFGLYVALWFWIGLLVDFGVFKAFGVDWVEEVPKGVRLVLLTALSFGLLVLVTLKLLFRLLKEFRDGPLALVLERRFPDILGDRLITAVELADPRLAERYGYSPGMIEQTIRAAAERVDRLPLGEVFAWRRLRRTVLWVAGLSAGLYVLLGIAYCALARSRIGDFAPRFNNIAAIWFERNILLNNIPWPRRVHLELVNFPENGDLRVGRNAPSPGLRVRAIKWAIADLQTEEGWRALKGSDLGLARLNLQVDATVLPAQWREWTVDQIETEIDKPRLEPVVDLEGIRQILDALERLARRPSMNRVVRRLDIPDLVTVHYRGDTIRSEQTLKKQEGNEYSGVLSDLKESVRFRVNGEDYYTPYKRITLVPPPGLTELTRDEEQPAYLHERPPAGGESQDLRGKKQIFMSLPVSLSGTASRIDVPAGTNVVLKGKTDKPLPLSAGVHLRPREGSAPIKVPIRQFDEHSFEVRFNNITTPFDFVFELTDTDHVVGLRPVVIKPIDDTPPEVDVLVEVIRKNNQGYLVSPRARIPFSGRVRDDHGLENIEYVYTLVSAESQALAGTGPIVSAFQFSAGGVGADFLNAAYLSWLAGITRSLADQANQPGRRIPLGTFARRLQELTAGDVPRQRPGERPQGKLLRDYVLDYSEEFRDKIPGDDFDIGQLGLKVSEDDEAQLRYRMHLWVTATDNNVETGPGIGQSKERFTFLIISENELLVEIAKEEESLHIKLEDTVNKLKDSRTKLDQVAEELPGLKQEEFSPMARRTEEIGEVLTKGWDVTREVYMDYRRILKELQFNRVRLKIIEKVERNICEPLDGAINQEFVRAEEMLRVFHKTLEDRKAEPQAAKQTREELDKLIDRLTHILDAMGEISNINKLIEQLVRIEKGVMKGHERFKELSDRLQDALFEKALNPDKPE